MRRRSVRPPTDVFLTFAPPGHFYSPLPDRMELSSRRHLFDQRVLAIPGIAVNDARQLTLVPTFRALMPDVPFRDVPADGLRYHFDNEFFTRGDGLVLYAMLRHLQPRRVIEVGSGFSSALMLDTADRFLRDPSFTFIEPYPDNRLLKLMTVRDRERHRVLRAPVQDVPLDTFDVLEANDVLFIDSSHVAKFGSDVVHLLTYVLPRVKAGVYVHIHDIFWPFEYPENWLTEGRAWNEAYIVKAFLQFNTAFEIVWFSSYLAAHHSDTLKSALPLMFPDTGASLWLVRTATGASS